MLLIWVDKCGVRLIYCLNDWCHKCFGPVRWHFSCWVLLLKTMGNYGEIWSAVSFSTCVGTSLVPVAFSRLSNLSFWAIPIISITRLMIGIGGRILLWRGNDSLVNGDLNLLLRRLDLRRSAYVVSVPECRLGILFFLLFLKSLLIYYLQSEDWIIHIIC